MLKQMYNSVCEALRNNTFNETFTNEQQESLKRFKDQVKLRSVKANAEATQKIPFIHRNAAAIVSLALLVLIIGTFAASHMFFSNDNISDETSANNESITQISQPIQSISSTVSENQMPESAQSTDKINIGDTVYFSGTVQYMSSYDGSAAIQCPKGVAKITAINNGQAHPFHIVSAKGDNLIYGWVNEEDIILN